MSTWDLTVRFFSFADPAVRWVTLGSVLLGMSAGALGCFAFLQRRSLIGDVLAHAALPGIGLAFLLAGRKEFALLLLGAAIASWFGAQAVNLISRHSMLKQDTALGIVLSSFFGLGIVILTAIQRTGDGAQSGLNGFLFGQAAALTQSDVTTIGVTSLLLLVLLCAGYPNFKAITFDRVLAASLGLRVGLWQAVLTIMIVGAVVVGLQSVGVILIAALLIAPAAAARQWTDRLSRMLLIAALFGGMAGVAGTYFSFFAPKLPTGPLVIVSAIGIFAFSILFAPHRGLLAAWRKRRKQRIDTAVDHVLKYLYRTTRESQIDDKPPTFERVRNAMTFDRSLFRTALKHLLGNGWVAHLEGTLMLTPPGVVEAARIVRRHRLWEVYLTRYLELPGDHVHRDAESMEHIITPELEEELERMLERPTRDPHDQAIPYPEEEPR